MLSSCFCCSFECLLLLLSLYFFADFGFWRFFKNVNVFSLRWGPFGAVPSQSRRTCKMDVHTHGYKTVCRCQKVARLSTQSLLFDFRQTKSKIMSTEQYEQLRKIEAQILELQLETQKLRRQLEWTFEKKLEKILSQICNVTTTNDSSPSSALAFSLIVEEDVITFICSNMKQGYLRPRLYGRACYILTVIVMLIQNSTSQVMMIGNDECGEILVAIESTVWDYSNNEFVLEHCMELLLALAIKSTGSTIKLQIQNLLKNLSSFVEELECAETTITITNIRDIQEKEDEVVGTDVSTNSGSTYHTCHLFH